MLIALGIIGLIIYATIANLLYQHVFFDWDHADDLGPTMAAVFWPVVIVVWIIFMGFTFIIVKFTKFLEWLFQYMKENFFSSIVVLILHIIRR